MHQAMYALEIGSQLVDATRRAGANDAEVYLRHGPTTRITLQYNRISQSEGWETGLALRAWCGDRSAFLTTNHFAPDSLTALAERVVLEAKQQGIIDQPWLREGQDIEILNQTPTEVSIITPEEKVATLQELLTMVSKNWPPAQTIMNVSYSDSTVWTALVNSRNFAAAYETTLYSMWIWVEGASGHLVTATSGRQFDELELAALGQYLNDRVDFLKQPLGQAPDGPCQVLLPPLAAADLSRALGSLLTGENVIGSIQPLLKRINTPIATGIVTLIDDGRVAGGMKGRPIDDEGTPTQATTLIEQGTLRELLHTRQTAAYLGIPPNGKAVRPTPWDLPRSAPSNIYLKASEMEPESLRQQLQQGVVVVGVLRPGRIHNTTGKYTTVVQGWWVEDKKQIRPVSSVQLSINIFELLRNVRYCGNDLQFSPLAAGAGAPSLLIERIQVG